MVLYPPLVRSYYDKTEGIMTDVSTLSDENTGISFA